MKELPEMGSLSSLTSERRVIGKESCLVPRMQLTGLPELSRTRTQQTCLQPETVAPARDPSALKLGQEDGERQPSLWGRATIVITISKKQTSKMKETYLQ